MQQQAHKTVAALIHAGTKLSAGAGSHAASLGLTVGTKPLVDADLAGLTTATTTHIAAQAVLREHRIQLKQATRAAYDVVISIRDLLRRTLGRSYSRTWEGTGFNHSLRISRDVVGLEHQLRSLAGYLTDHPSLEVANIATAAIAEETLNALTTANTAVTVQKGTLKTLLNKRRQKEKIMHRRIRGVVEELHRVIGGVDGRWDAFGLNQPGLKQAPPKPENVTVEVTNDTGTVKWDKTPRAQYYRVFLKIIGVDEEARPIGTPADNIFPLENLQPNTQYELWISALNNGGESARSNVLLFQTMGSIQGEG